MAAVKGRDTKPEILIRKLLFSLGYRFRLQRKDLPGRPDIVLPRYKTAIFVNGCFWHQHEGCKASRIPASNTEYWSAKLSRNVERDKKNQALLREMGWNVLVIWECEIKNIIQTGFIPGLPAKQGMAYGTTDDELLEAAEETEDTP